MRHHHQSSYIIMRFQQGKAIPISHKHGHMIIPTVCYPNHPSGDGINHGYNMHNHHQLNLLNLLTMIITTTKNLSQTWHMCVTPWHSLRPSLGPQCHELAVEEQRGIRGNGPSKRGAGGIDRTSEDLMGLGLPRAAKQRLR